MSPPYPAYCVLNESERIEVRVIGGARKSVSLYKQDFFDGEWNTDPDSGLVFPAAKVNQLCEAIREALQ